MFKLANPANTNGGAQYGGRLLTLVLFLSKESNMFIHDKTLGKNCIYFTFFGYDFGVYSLTDRSIKPLVLLKGHSDDIYNSLVHTSSVVADSYL